MPASPRAPPPPRDRPLTVADRRLIKERRVKLSIAGVVLAVFALLIVIALGGLGNQFLASIQNSAPEENLLVDAAPTGESAPPTAESAPPPEESAAASTAAGPAPAPVKIVGGNVYDPQGDGNPDYAAYADRAYDGNAESAWLTWVYKRQFPSLKGGVGLMLELEREVTPTSVVITSATPGTTIEVRSATDPSTPLDQTTGLATATVASGPLTIPLPPTAPKSKYLLLYVTAMSPTADNQFQAKINEITINGT